MPFDLHYIREHKWLMAGIAGAAVVGIVIIARARSGGGAVQSGIDPTQAALYGQAQQLEGQQAQIQGSLDLASIQAGTQSHIADLTAGVNLADISAKRDTSLADIAATHDLGLAQIAEQLQATNDNLTLSTHAIDAQLAGLESNNATTAQIANISAGEQVAIANVTGQTQIAISNNATQANIAASNANVEIAGLNASAIKQQSNDNMWGKVAGIAGSLIGAFI